MSIRKMEREDLSELKSLKDESWWGTHKTSLINMDDQMKWYETTKDTCLIVYKKSKSKNHFLHYVTEQLGILIISQYDPISRVAHASGSGFKRATKAGFAKDAWQCGIDFAFEIFNLHRLEAEVMSYNIPAQKLNIEAAGMRVEGVRRSSIYKSGQYYDSLMLGLLRSEWEQDPRVMSYNGSCNLNFDHERADRLISKSRYT